MKKIIYTIILLLAVNMSYSQISEQTKNKIKVKFIRAQENYDSAKYLDAIKNIDEIENLLNGSKNPTAQNLKVKALIGAKQYQKAQKELNILYSLNPSQNILKDIASYEGKINDGIKSEKLRSEKERLEEVRRKEQQRLAKIKRIEKEKRDRERRIVAQNEKQKKLQKYSLIFDRAIRNNSFKIDTKSSTGKIWFMFKNGNRVLQEMSAQSFVSLYNEVCLFEITTVEGRKQYYKRAIEINKNLINKYNLSTKYVPLTINKLHANTAYESYSYPRKFFGSDYERKFYGYVNKEGEILFKNLKSGFSDSYNIYANWFSEGIAIVSSEKKMLFINDNGSVITDLSNKLRADYYNPYVHFKDNRVIFKSIKLRDLTFKIFNKNGDLIFSKSLSSNYRIQENHYSDGLLPVSFRNVKKKTKYGFLDKNGELVIPTIYYGYLSPGFNNGKAIVLKRKLGKIKVFEINKKGEIIREIKPPKKYKIGYDDNKWVFINKKRQTLPIE